MDVPSFALLQSALTVGIPGVMVWRLLIGAINGLFAAI